jgi:hypothetical protein
MSAYGSRVSRTQAVDVDRGGCGGKVVQTPSSEHTVDGDLAKYVEVL